MRQKLEGTVIVEAIRAARRREFRPVHFSIQGDHIHFIIEADSREDLVKGMRGLGCRIARGLNKLWNRKGSVFPQRFHERVLKSLTQVRNALRYVLNNHRKHQGGGPLPTRPDPFSTGIYFNGWSDFPQEHDPSGADSCVSPPGWKIAIGWQRYNPRFFLAAIPG